MGRQTSEIKIKVILIKKSEIEEVEKVLKHRFAHAVVLKGTQSHHRFEPVGLTHIRMFKTSAHTTSTTSKVNKVDDPNKLTYAKCQEAAEDMDPPVEGPRRQAAVQSGATVALDQGERGGEPQVGPEGEPEGLPVGEPRDRRRGRPRGRRAGGQSGSRVAQGHGDPEDLPGGQPEVVPVGEPGSRHRGLPGDRQVGARGAQSRVEARVVARGGLEVELETEPGGQPGSPQADAQMGAGGGPGHGLLQVPGDVCGPVAPRGGPRGRGWPRGRGIRRGQP